MLDLSTNNIIIQAGKFQKRTIVYRLSSVCLQWKIKSQASLLPPAYVVRREGNIFTGSSLSVHMGEVPQSQVLSQVSGSRSFLWRYLSHRLFPRSLVPGPFWGGGYPSPCLGDTRIGLGYPPAGTVLGYPPSGLGYPPPPETEQQSEYLLRGGWYAPWGHVGGPSCLEMEWLDLNILM